MISAEHLLLKTDPYKKKKIKIWHKPTFNNGWVSARYLVSTILIQSNKKVSLAPFSFLSTVPPINTYLGHISFTKDLNAKTSSGKWRQNWSRVWQISRYPLCNTTGQSASCMISMTRRKLRELFPVYQQPNQWVKQQEVSIMLSRACLLYELHKSLLVFLLLSFLTPLYVYCRDFWPLRSHCIGY